MHSSCWYRDLLDRIFEYFLHLPVLFDRWTVVICYPGYFTIFGCFPWFAGLVCRGSDQERQEWRSGVTLCRSCRCHMWQYAAMISNELKPDLCFAVFAMLCHDLLRPIVPSHVEVGAQTEEEDELLERQEGGMLRRNCIEILLTTELTHSCARTGRKH